MNQTAELRPGGEPVVRMRHVSKRFGDTVAVQPLNLDIYRGDFLAILGPSGCGKTTLLRMIGGFLSPTSGRIEIGGNDVTTLGPERRPTNMVFQGYGLFPHMSVRQNIAYGLRVARRPKDEINDKVRDTLALVHLAELADRMPGQLSGGQQQRVALARALVMQPDVLLLDEPLAALDLKLRKAMQDELRRIHQSVGGTFVFVTHDQGEALELANRIAVMQNGRVVQEGGPQEIYSSPATRFVATFIGDANILPGTRSNGTVALTAGGEVVDSGAEGPVTLVVRPEAITICRNGPAPEVTLDGEVLDAVFLGSYIKYKVLLRDKQVVTIHDSHTGRAPDIVVGQRVRIGWAPASHSVLDGA